MKNLIIALAVLTLFAGMAFAKPLEDTPVYERQQASDAWGLIFHDDMNTGAPGWYSVDETTLPPKFHVDNYYGYGGGDSYWCGELNGTFTSGDGYGNVWNEMLYLPEVDWTGAGYPIWTFRYRFDSEVAYDFTYVQAESLGVFKSLNPGYDGKSGGWQYYGVYGFEVAMYDLPLIARYNFISDGAWSDEDALYDSDGGAFHCDDIEVFDFYGGTQYFFDDAGTTVGPFCTPSGPAAVGDFWHLVTDICSSYSPPTSWWCGDDADTSFIPPFVKNALFSPMIDISGAVTCTIYHAVHAEVPTGEDGWNTYVAVDGGDFFQTNGWYGDFGGCSGWGSAGLRPNGINVYDWTGGPGSTQLQFKIRFHASENGSGPGTGGGAGINLDDFWVYGDVEQTPVESSSWGTIKRMFK